MRQMVMVGFLQAQNCTTLASAWRHPEARDDFTTAAYYQKIGQVLEEGKFQLAFFDDRLAMPDIYGGNPAEVVANGVRVIKMDPVATLMAMGSLLSAAATPTLAAGGSTSTSATTSLTTAWPAELPAPTRATSWPAHSLASSGEAQ